MPRTSNPDILIVNTHPSALSAHSLDSPFDVERPEDLVFCVFFKEMDDRTRFLNTVRTLAGKEALSSSDREERNLQLQEEYAKLRDADEPEEAFFALIRWWTGVMRRGYHSYSLKIGFAPYRTSCVISFRELETDLVKESVAHGVKALEAEKSRILGFFGMQEYGGLN